MGALRGAFAENDLWAWLVALGVFVLTVVLLQFAKWVVRRRLAARYARTKSELAHLVGDLVRRTHLLFILVVALLAASLALTLPAAAAQAMRTLAVLALLMQFASWGSRLVSFWVNRQIRQKIEEEKDAVTATTLNAVGFLAKIALWTVVLLLALENSGVDVTALITGLGIAGIAVALALQNILGDLFASIAIVVDKPFLVGDFIVVGNHMGTVERVGLKTTRIRSLSGEQLIYSNSELLKNVVQNYKRMSERRVAFTFTLPYATPHDKLVLVPAIAREVVAAQPNARFDLAHLKEYGEFGIVYEVVYFVLVPEFAAYRDVHQAILLELLRRFREEGIAFAYPTRVVHVQPNPHPAKGDHRGH